MPSSTGPGDGFEPYDSTRHLLGDLLVEFASPKLARVESDPACAELDQNPL